MWLRHITTFSTLAQHIYRGQNVAERIRVFQAINIDESRITPLSIENPRFLREARAKDILEYVKINHIPNNIRILHALAHIEYNAFMSYADTVFRFRDQTGPLSGEFTKDMREIAIEEGSHFNLLRNRLLQLGYDYGCMPVIAKLSLAIRDTEHSLTERIGVISLIHEGRGVKAVEKLLHQLGQLEDRESVSVVRVIQKDEHKHFEMGWKWFFKVCQQKGLTPAQQIETINAKYLSNIQIPTSKLENHQLK